jgi:hypothetical protein
MYVKVNNDQAEIFPYTLGMLKKDYPRTSFPKQPSKELLSQYGMCLVESAPEPTYDKRTQRIAQKDLPDFIDGKWVVEWSVFQKEQEQINKETETQAETIRSQRNDLLAKCDWTVLVDSPLTEEKRAEWITYRQALRDISDLPDFPWVDLPNNPDYANSNLENITPETESGV